jgi:uncharacterized protein (TIGR02452 family)
MSALALREFVGKVGYDNTAAFTAGTALGIDIGYRIAGAQGAAIGALVGGATTVAVYQIGKRFFAQEPEKKPAATLARPPRALAARARRGAVRADPRGDFIAKLDQYRDIGPRHRAAIINAYDTSGGNRKTFNDNIDHLKGITPGQAYRAIRAFDETSSTPRRGWISFIDRYVDSRQLTYAGAYYLIKHYETAQTGATVRGRPFNFITACTGMERYVDKDVLREIFSEYRASFAPRRHRTTKPSPRAPRATSRRGAPAATTRLSPAEIAAAKQRRIDTFHDTLSLIDGLEAAHRGSVPPTQLSEVFRGTGKHSDIYTSVLSHGKGTLSDALKPLKSGRGSAHVEVVRSDTLEAMYRDPTLETPLVLNMASAFVLGGGVARGCRAQEERLCRTTTQHSSLTYTPEVDGEYALKAHSIEGKRMVYSPHVVDLKHHDEPAFTLRTPPRGPFSVVSVAGVKLKEGQRVNFPHLKEIYREKITAVIRLAQTKGHKSIIWGALGCGAYSGKNPAIPGFIASVFREILDEVRDGGGIKHIFAVLDDQNAPSRTGNSQTFADTLTGGRITR